MSSLTPDPFEPGLCVCATPLQREGLALSQEVVERHARGSELFAGAGSVNLRHDPPASRDAALQRVAVALRDIVQKAGNRELSYLADLDVSASAQELNDQLQIALDMVAESGRRVACTSVALHLMPVGV